MAESSNLDRKMQRTAFACVGIVVGMVGLAYASVPLYDLFCKVKLGETTTVYYKVTNTGDRPSTGIATYNVQPDLAGTYFSKLECFCFTEQTLQPGETLESAVVFYVDPRLVQDSDVKDLTSITLSYTYFPSKGGKPVAEATSSTKPIAQ